METRLYFCNKLSSEKKTITIMYNILGDYTLDPKNREKRTADGDVKEENCFSLILTNLVPTCSVNACPRKDVVCPFQFLLIHKNFASIGYEPDSRVMTTVTSLGGLMSSSLRATTWTLYSVNGCKPSTTHSHDSPSYRRWDPGHQANHSALECGTISIETMNLQRIRELEL